MLYAGMKYERNLATTDDSDPAPSAQAGAPTLLLVYCGGAPAPVPQPLPVRPGTTVLGRAPDTEGGLCIPENRVSRVHAVIHYEPAGDAKDYLHRSGRTARAGRDGWARATRATPTSRPPTTTSRRESRLLSGISRSIRRKAWAAGQG